jgi:uncharacterized protein YfiM (DUF2279 family)
MSKRTARPKKRRAEKSGQNSGRKLVVIICSLLLLTLGVGLTAQWRMLPVMSRPPAQPQAGSFNSNNPSKEYIYAGGRLIATEEATAVAAPLAPANLIARASSTQINLTWDAPSGATGYSYQIERSTNYSTATPEHGFAPVATGITGTSFTDNLTGLSGTHTYLYRVRSFVSGQSSVPSNMSFATNIAFAETISNQDPGRTTIKATHFLELAAAVNAVRAAAGLQDFNWSTQQAPASGGLILKSQLKDLRDGLNQALDALGISRPSYTDDLSSQSAVPVRKAHIDELRQATRGVGQN